MMILRCAMLLAAALTLSNCCLSSSGCNTPIAANAAPAWDGLGQQSGGPEAEADPAPPKAHARRKTSGGVDAMSSQSNSGARANLGWQEQQAVDTADDARLKQKLIICRNCAGTQ
jgi:hypothetical protein